MATPRIEIDRTGVLSDLTDLVSWNVEHWRGFGVPAVRSVTQRGPSQHGETFLTQRYEPRTVILAVTALADTEYTWHVRRALLADMFRAGDDLFTLRYFYNDGASGEIARYLDCYVATPPDFSTEQRVGFSQRTTVALRAPEPTWYDPVPVFVPFSQGSGGAALTFPLAFSFTLGASGVSQSQSIPLTDPGMADVYPIVTIKGPITNALITNGTTGDKLDLTGTTIAGGDYYIIDTRYGRKSVTDAAGVSRIASLVNSDLGSFNLRKGENSIIAFGTGTDANTQISFTYYKRFLGV